MLVLVSGFLLSVEYYRSTTRVFLINATRQPENITRCICRTAKIVQRLTNDYKKDEITFVLSRHFILRGAPRKPERQHGSLRRDQIFRRIGGYVLEATKTGWVLYTVVINIHLRSAYDGMQVKWRFLGARKVSSWEIVNRFCDHMTRIVYDQNKINGRALDPPHRW